MDAPLDPLAPQPEQHAQQKRAAQASLRQRERIFLSVFLVVAMVAWVNVKRVEVKGISMEPTFHSGDLAIVWKTVPRASLRPGDVVVFRSADGDELIKRIVAVQSGPVPDFPDWLTLSNGRREAVAALFSPFNSPYFAGRMMGRVPPPAPDRTIYVLGDNLMHSNDSRDFGPISPRQLLGKVVP
jgi:signal peptidase I